MNPDLSPPSVGLNKDALARLGASIQADIDSGKHFGASILVARHGQVAYQATFGTVAPGRAPSGDDRYLLMSMSKAYTATLVCWRRWNIDQLCRLNFDQGLTLPPQEVSCG